MNIESNPQNQEVEGTMIRRVVISPDFIEFLDQGFTLSRDADTLDVNGHSLADTGFINTKLEEAWDIMVNVPLDPAPPSDMAESLRGIETAPNIQWPDDLSTPPVIIPYTTGPMVQITVGQAVMALAIYADSLRNPPVGAPEATTMPPTPPFPTP